MILMPGFAHCGLLLALTLSVAGCDQQDKAQPPAAAMTLEDCAKLPDPVPSDESAATKANAVSQGIAVRDACRKTVAANTGGNDDLARIRAIKEDEAAERKASKAGEEKAKRGFKEGGERPVKEYKF